MTSPLPITAYDSAAETSTEAWVGWEAFIIGTSEPAFLARILQKAQPSEAEILTLHFQVAQRTPNSAFRETTVLVRFRAAPTRAHSVAEKWRKIVTVHGVTLTAVPTAAIASGPASGAPPLNHGQRRRL